MHPRIVTGADVPAAVADVLAGGSPIAVADSGTLPSTWSLDGPALESGQMLRDTIVQRPGSELS